MNPFSLIDASRLSNRNHAPLSDGDPSHDTTRLRLVDITGAALAGTLISFCVLFSMPALFH